jgi:hypothetical protein
MGADDLLQLSSTTFKLATCHTCKKARHDMPGECCGDWAREHAAKGHRVHLTVQSTASYELPIPASALEAMN